jgi:uncharacterized protein
MTTILAFFFMLLIVAGMAVGVIFGRKPIAGSCGGMKALGLDAECEVCGGNPHACDRADAGSRIHAAQVEAASLGVDAAARPRNGGNGSRTL